METLNRPHFDLMRQSFFFLITALSRYSSRPHSPPASSPPPPPKGTHLWFLVYALPAVWGHFHRPKKKPSCPSLAVTPHAPPAPALGDPSLGFLSAGLPVLGVSGKRRRYPVRSLVSGPSG